MTKIYGISIEHYVEALEKRIGVLEKCMGILLNELNDMINYNNTDGAFVLSETFMMAMDFIAVDAEHNEKG